MKKDIIQIMFPVNENGVVPISFDAIDFAEQNLKKQLGTENYAFIAYPYDIKVLSGDTKIYTFEGKQYTHEELKKIIEGVN